MRVLLVEDDHMIGDVVAHSLKDEGYAMDWVRDGEAAILALEGQRYDLILLDLGLPGVDGYAVLNAARRQDHPAGVLVITARGAAEDCVRSLDGGADDHIMKPFSLEALHARMRAVLRRRAGQVFPVLGNGLLSLDPGTKEVRREDKVVPLSAREFSLLHALLIRPGAILSRRELEERIYDWSDEVESNVVEFLIHSLRKKLGSDAIKNVRGLGWMVAKAR